MHSTSTPTHCSFANKTINVVVSKFEHKTATSGRRSTDLKLAEQYCDENEKCHAQANQCPLKLKNIFEQEK